MGEGTRGGGRDCEGRGGVGGRGKEMGVGSKGGRWE